LAALSVAASLKKVSDDSMALIASCLDHTDPLVKRAAANCLGAYQSKDAADFLAKALSGEVSTRVVVLNALAKSGQKVGSDEIVLQLNDTDDKIRYAAANTMFRCQIDDKADALKKALEAEKAREPANIYQADFKERIIALLQASLLVTGEAEGEELATAMQVKNTWVRELAIEAFGIHKEVDILISSCFENFENGNGRLRLSAAQAFTALAPVKNFPKIIALMETEKEGEIREELAASLRRISKHNFGYNGHDSEKARATSLKVWSKWWLQNAYRYGLSSE
jgi:HEAT repeat protein